MVSAMPSSAGDLAAQLREGLGESPNGLARSAGLRG